MWDAILQLSKIEPFNDPDKKFIDHMIKYHEDWRRFIDQSSE